jgi:hypothetical protein
MRRSNNPANPERVAIAITVPIATVITAMIMVNLWNPFHAALFFRLFAILKHDIAIKAMAAVAMDQCTKRLIVHTPCTWSISTNIRSTRQMAAEYSRVNDVRVCLFNTITLEIALANADTVTANKIKMVAPNHLDSPIESELIKLLKGSKFGIDGATIPKKISNKIGQNIAMLAQIRGLSEGL